MRTIELHAKTWASELDFYKALLAALGAPEWHGLNVNALVDSMIWGGINRVEPAYAIRVMETSSLPRNLREEMELVKRALANGRAEYQKQQGQDVEVSLEIGR